MYISHSTHSLTLIPAFTEIEFDLESPSLSPSRTPSTSRLARSMSLHVIANDPIPPIVFPHHIQIHNFRISKSMFPAKNAGAKHSNQLTAIFPATNPRNFTEISKKSNTTTVNPFTTKITFISSLNYSMQTTSHSKPSFSPFDPSQSTVNTVHCYDDRRYMCPISYRD